jgi:hypothetical protein
MRCLSFSNKKKTPAKRFEPGAFQRAALGPCLTGMPWKRRQ